MDGLVDASKEPFVHCYECPMPFCGSPADMVHHLTDACSGHCWPLAENIKYEMCYPFTMPESLEDHRRLLVSEEDGSVFLLIVGTGEAMPLTLTLTRGRCTGACSLLLPLGGTSAATLAMPSILGLCRAGTFPPMWTWKTHGMI